MGLILWIDENTFATGLIARAFKKDHLSFYTTSQASDFSYLIEDLSPEAIVLDVSTALNFLDEVKKQYESSLIFQNKPIILIDPAPGLEFITNVKGSLQKPLDPFTVADKIRKIIDA